MIRLPKRSTVSRRAAGSGSTVSSLASMRVRSARGVSRSKCGANPTGAL
jgi:hypothetical protein